jgi:hypothetical protein
MKIQEGEVFAIQTKTGFGFLQYIKPDQFGNLLWLFNYPTCTLISSN